MKIFTNYYKIIDIILGLCYYLAMQKLLSKIRRCCQEYNLIEEGDKIAVGLSGGKDSLVLLTALAQMRRFYPKKYEVVAITIDLFNGESNMEKLKEYCKQLDVEFYPVKSQIYDIVFETRKESNPCSLCAKLRRGILNNTASQIGCNKVALGHHLDDLVQTFFLSMFYEGRLSTFMPNTYLTSVNLNVIRPMLFVEENEIISVSKKLNMPVMNNCCPANHKTEREHIKEIIAYIKKEIPISKDRIFKAIISPERYNLFDKFYKEYNLDIKEKTKKWVRN